MNRICPNCGEKINLFKLRKNFNCDKCISPLASNIRAMYFLSVFLSGGICFLVLFLSSSFSDTDTVNIVRFGVFPVMVFGALYIFGRFGKLQIFKQDKRGQT